MILNSLHKYNNLLKLAFDFNKFARQLSTKEIHEKLLKAQTVTNETVDSYIDELENDWLDTTKIISKYIEQLHDLTRSSQAIQQNKNHISKFLEEIKNYGELEDYQLVLNVTKIDSKKLTQEKNNELFQLLYSIFKDLERYKSFYNDFASKIQKIQYEHHYGGKIYIRFGKFPKSEHSRIGLDEEWISELSGKRFEDGVSVYNTSPWRGKWILREPNYDKAMYASKFDIGFFAERIAAGEIYLVTGEELSETGVDGEPLLRDIFPIKRLSPNEIKLGYDEKSPTLEEYLSKYYHTHDVLGPFVISDSEKREIALLSGLLENYLEVAENSDLEKLNLSYEDSEELFEIIYKLKKNKFNFEILSPEELTKLKKVVEKYKKIRNKSQVMKGFRPFY